MHKIRHCCYEGWKKILVTTDRNSVFPVSLFREYVKESHFDRCKKQTNIFSSRKGRNCKKKQGGGQYARCPKKSCFLTEVVPSALQVSPLSMGNSIFSGCTRLLPTLLPTCTLHSRCSLHFTLPGQFFLMTNLAFLSLKALLTLLP